MALISGRGELVIFD